MAKQAPSLEVSFLIGQTPDRSRAVPVPMQPGDSFGAGDREDALRLFHLSDAQRRIGKWRQRLPNRHLHAPTLSVKIDRRIYDEALSGLGEFYVWKITTRVDDGSVYDEQMNKAWRSRMIRDREWVHVTLKYVYAEGIQSIDDLLDREAEDPFGDFNQPHCECKGAHDRWWGWVKRALGCSDYTYTIDQSPAWSEERVFGGVVQYGPTFLIERHTKDGGIQWECICGAWTEVRLEDGARDYMTVRLLYDSRSAEERANYLRRGIPMRWRLWVVILSLSSTPIGFAVWWLLNRYLGYQSG